ncbi:MAG: DUF2341 domain-containing protein, partial [Chitinivibrionales bacterium]|nr:DUF2341 domain-containing protein [Chitinivibrionales bacterium]
MRPRGTRAWRLNMDSKTTGARPNVHARTAFIAVIAIAWLATRAGAASWEGLVAYWPLDEGTGTTINDVTGRNQGTRDVATGWQAGAPNLQFANPGSIDFSYCTPDCDIIVVPDSPSLDSIDVTGQFTLSLWYNPAASFPQDYGIMGRENLMFGQNGTHGLQLFLDGGSTQTPSSVVVGDTWQHVAVTYDRATSTATFYVGGSAVHNGTVSSSSLASDQNWHVHNANGYVNHNGHTGSADYDDCRVYKRVLSQAEIQSLAAGRGEFPQWAHSRKVYLNTTATGANVANDVTDFPVLIRLTDAMIPFTEFQGGGADLRFAKAGGVIPLPYEIEDWNGTTGEAAIWVKVDTVYGANSDQYFMMYWGKTGVVDSSSSAAVFDNANHFGGVWHFDEAPSDGGAFVDATANNINMYARNFQDTTGGGGSTDAVGLADGGMYLDTANDFAETHNHASLEPPNNMMVSVWVRPNRTATSGESILMNRKNESGGAQWFGYWLRTQYVSGRPVFEWVNADDSVSMVEANTSLVLSEWHHVVGVRDGAQLRVYVDGVDRSGFRRGTPSGVLSDPEWGLKVGAENGTSRHFHGVTIDEVRVEATARSDDWIRLCYMNQRPDDSLITLGTVTCDPVAITAHPQDTSVEANTTATFRVVAVGTNRQYQWYKNASPIGGATQATYSYTAPLSDSGAAFHCEVSGDCGGAQTSQVATLSVTTPCQAIVIQNTLRDTTITVGGSVSFSISATGTSPQYQWQKDGIDIPGQTAGTYATNPVDASHAGSYQCVVRNGCSQQTSNAATLSICVPPSITAHPQNADVIAGENALFQISASGSGLGYQWERDTGSGFSPIAGATLATYSVEPATLEDSGHVFQCRVTGGCGMVTSNACTLTVNAACTPVGITQHPQDTSVIEHSSVTLRLSVTGTNPVFQWYRGASPIAEATGNTHTFTARRRDNGVSYTCEVSGDCSVPIMSSAAVLSVADTTRPHPTTALTLNALGPNDINVRWSTPETDSTDGDSVFVYYATDTYQHHSWPGKSVLVADTVSTATGEREANLGSLSPETEYFFSMWLKDTVGNWAYADSGSVTTGAAGTPTNPVVVRGEYVSDTQIRLTLSNFCQLPSAVNPFNLYADYVGVWYQSGDYVLTPDTTDAHLLRFPVAALQTATGCPGVTQRDTTVTLPELVAPDSTYYLSVSVVWRNPDTVMVFTRANGDSVLMRDVTPPGNPCTISGSYPGGRSDSAFVLVGNVSAMESKVHDMVVFCSFDTTFADTFFTVTLPADSVVANAVNDT